MEEEEVRGGRGGSEGVQEEDVRCRRGGSEV